MTIEHIIGNPQLLERPKTLFLCSKRAPFGCYERIFQWVEGLTPDDCVMCFNTTELEEEVLQALLVARIPTVLLTMEHFPSHTFNQQIEQAREEQRLAIVVLHRDEPRGARATPLLRNRYAISLAKDIVCGYVSQMGSIAPLLWNTDKPVTRLLDGLPQPLLEEGSSPRHARWTVGEDKCLLRMHYADMGIHAMHQALGRPYATIRQRVKALCLCDEALMGREFEDYVLELLGIGSNPRITLREWRGDKILGDIFPQANSLPDLVLEVDGNPLALECKWRSRLTASKVEELFTPERLEKFQQYAAATATPVYLLLGIGGIPSYPDGLYLVPLDQELTLDTLKANKVSPDDFFLPSSSQQRDRL